jgi:hypothetical protein
VPREVGELVVYYLWFASLFYRQINRAVRGKAVDRGKYVWEPQPKKGWQMPDRKRRRRGGASSQNSSSSSKRARASDRARASVDPATSQDVWEESADNSKPPAEQQREVELWNSNQVMHAIQKESLQHMAVKLNIMGWRHSSKAAFRRYINNPVAVQAFAGADAEEDKEEGSSKDKL